MSEQQGILKKVFKYFSFDNDDAEMEDLGSAGPEKDRSQDKKIVSLHNKRTATIKPAEISIFSPGSYEDALVVADRLKEGSAVVINLGRIDVSLATRVLDFVSGIIHAIDGSFKKVGDNIFVFTPANIDITPDTVLRGVGGKESDGLFFSNER